MELKKDEKVKKIPNGYKHTISVIYPDVNVKNMMDSWRKTVQKTEEWLNNYDEHLKDAERLAEKAVNDHIEQHESYVNEILAMEKEERRDRLESDFYATVDKINEMKENKQKYVDEQLQANKEMLEKIKAQYEEEQKNKKEAIKKWTIE